MNTLQPGQVLDGKYRVVRQIGRGAMGIVYEAVHVALGRRVAVKTLRADTSVESDLVSRFEREARAASAIGHPHIVDVFDLGRTAEGELFMVMELLAGRTLAAWLKEERLLPVDVAVDLMAQVLGGLGAAHREGIVHRDLKPDNIFIIRRDDRANFVKVLDFGISKILVASEHAHGVGGTAVGTVMGTPRYMSPEQSLGNVAHIDRRSDLYSAGVVLYEMLCGRTPFEGDSHSTLFHRILEGSYPPPQALRTDIPANVAAAIERALDRDKERRFGSAAEMRDALVGKRQDRESSPDVASVVPSRLDADLHGTVSLGPRNAGGTALFDSGEWTKREKRAHPVPRAERGSEASIVLNEPEVSLDSEPSVHEARLELDRSGIRHPRPAPAVVRPIASIDVPRLSRTWFRRALVALAIVVVAGTAVVRLRGSRSTRGAESPPTLYTVTVLPDPAGALVQIDHVPVLKDELQLADQSIHEFFAEAPGRIARRISLKVVADLKVTLVLGRVLPLPELLDPEPLPLEIAGRYPSEPASSAEIGRAFAKLDRYAQCLRLLGYGESAKPRAVAPSASDISACVQLLDEANGLAPNMFPLAAAGRAYLQGLRNVDTRAPKLLSAFRAQFLAARTDWQMEELARTEKDQGQSPEWHMRNVALRAQLWWRRTRARVASLEDNRAALVQAYEAFRELAEHSPQQLVKTVGTEAFVKAAADVLVVAGQPAVKPEVGLRACRALLSAFNGLVF